MRSIDNTGLSRPARIDAGAVPMLQWVPIELLVVDETYQRPLEPANLKAIQRIADAFSWSKFSTVHVAPLEGGKFAIIDGQHRVHAALACGFSEVPCQVVLIAQSEQASAFSAINGIVTKVTVWNLYKAALAAGERWAAEADAACSAADCTLMTGNKPTDKKQPGEIFAVRMIRTAVDEFGAAGVTAGLRAVRDCPEYGANAAAYANQVLRPVVRAVGARKWLHKDGVGDFLDRFDVYAAEQDVDAYVRGQRSRGIATAAKHDHFEAAVGSALDKAFPQIAQAPKALTGGG